MGVPTGDPMESCNNFLSNLEIDLWKEHQEETKIEVASSVSWHSHHRADSLNVLPKKTCQLLKNDTVRQITRAECHVLWVYLQIAYRVEGRGVNQ